MVLFSGEAPPSHDPLKDSIDLCPFVRSLPTSRLVKRKPSASAMQDSCSSVGGIAHERSFVLLWN
jgi:hypothetical protein